MSPKKTADKKPSEEQDGLARGMNKTAAALAAVAMRGADPSQKFIVFSCYAISALAILVIGVPPYTEHKQLWACGVSGALIFIALMFVLWHYRKLIGSPAPGPNGNGPPPAPAVKPKNLDISVLQQKAIRDTLGDARKEAFRFLYSLNSDLRDEQVRANVFFPEYGPSGKWDDYVLKIRPGLHHNMNSDAEIAIVLRPKQGATGQVFDSGVPRVARKVDENSASGWEEAHRITPELEKILNKDLQWVISMPVTNGSEKPYGVMNVDGLVYEFTNDQLQDCMMALTTYPFIIDGFIRR